MFRAVKWVQLWDQVLWIEAPGWGGLPLPVVTPEARQAAWRGGIPAHSARRLRTCQVLENRTKDSKLEMEVLENLQELKDLNQRQAHVDFEAMLRQHRLSEEERQEREQEEDEREAA